MKAARTVKPIRSILAAALLACSCLTPAWSETLTDALVSAYRNSNLIEQNRAVLRAADEDVAQAVASLRPVIQFVTSGQYGYNETITSLGLPVTVEGTTGNYGLQASMTVYDFGRTQYAIEATRQTVLATREALLQVEQQVLLAAISAFVDVRLQQEIVALRENNVRVLSEELKATQDRFDVGEVTRTDVAQAQSSVAESEANLVAAQGALASARERYKAATGNYPGNLTAPPPPPRTAATLDEAKQIALRTHPAIRQAQYQVAAADFGVQRAKANMRPSISGTAQLSVNDGGFQENGLGMQFSQTLYAGGQLASIMRQAIANSDAQKANLAQQGVVVAQDVGITWADLDAAEASLTSTEQQIAAAEIAFEGVREEANLGARTTLDVLDAEQTLLDARASRLRVLATRYVSTYSLLASMGLLTVDHLKLGIPTYDPAAYYNAVRNAPAHSAQSKKLDRILKTIGQD
ncbi:TolC family outer membrane protein [Tabrizicola sp. J26]|uniref:TolC family outer membrane protein n=1 Tax=Alitabrizicola rongguiensis TaxID=2909234 RepID=UPI001F1C8F2F|nr:TolC family outer membrane protein [Tabrizicola rongguiensis]MCF1710928.1 TolC family outer membrane protein [Tabrizicola rongguiensis]